MTDSFLFFRPSQPLDIPLALRALRSSGEVTCAGDLASPWGKPERGGVLCQVLFGPLQDHRCACGALRGEEHHGERCPRCTVDCISSSARDTRWAHIDLPVGLVVPALFPVLAALLGLAEADVAAVVRGEASLDGDRIARPPVGEDPLFWRSGRGDLPPGELLRRRLSELPTTPELALQGLVPTDLIIDRVPVTPPGSRPLHLMQGGQTLPGPDTSAFKVLVGAARRLRRLQELNAPQIIQLNEASRLQATFEGLLDVLSGAPLQAIDARPPGPWPSNGAPPRGRMDRWTAPPPRAAFVGDDRLILQERSRVRVFDLVEGAVEHELQVGLGALRYVAADDRSIVFESGAGWHALDLTTGAWLDELPLDTPVCGIVEVQETPWIVNHRTGACRQVHDLGDYPVALATTHDGRFGWASDKEGQGGIYELATGLRHFVHKARAIQRLTSEERTVARIFGREVPEEPPPPLRMRRDGTCRPFRPRNDDADEPGDLVSAMALPEGGAWRVSAGPGLYEDGRLRLLFDFTVKTACFDRAGRNLAVVCRDAIGLISIDPEIRLKAWIPLG